MQVRTEPMNQKQKRKVVDLSLDPARSESDESPLRERLAFKTPVSWRGGHDFKLGNRPYPVSKFFALSEKAGSSI